MYWLDILSLYLEKGKSILQYIYPVFYTHESKRSNNQSYTIVMKIPKFFNIRNHNLFISACVTQSRKLKSR